MKWLKLLRLGLSSRPNQSSFACSIYSSSLKIKAIRFSETSSYFYQITRRHIPLYKIIKSSAFYYRDKHNKYGKERKMDRYCYTSITSAIRSCLWKTLPNKLVSYSLFEIRENYMTVDRCGFFIYLCLFNDAVSNPDYVASNELMIVNTELERMWKETVMMLSWDLPLETEENHDNT
jgi:hypothetical protein